MLHAHTHPQAYVSYFATLLGKPLPDLTFGINNSFQYKGFGLDIFFIGVRGMETLNNNILESLFLINFERNRIVEHYLDRWTPGNTWQGRCY